MFWTTLLRYALTTVFMGFIAFLGIRLGKKIRDNKDAKNQIEANDTSKLEE